MNLQKYIRTILLVAIVTLINVLCGQNVQTIAQTAGSLDTTFGGTGKVVTSVGTSDYADSVAVQADGKVVVAGFSRDYSIGKFFFDVVRYNTNGSLDGTFGGTGKVVTSIGGINDVALAVIIQSDGKIVVGGGSDNGSKYNFAVVRYNVDGTLDTSFNGTGKVITQIGTGNSAGEIQSIALQNDGKIVAVGRSYNDSKSNFAVVRYNSNGSLDASFNGTGIIVTPVGTLFDQANSVKIQTDGKIVVAGLSSSDEKNGFAVVRYNANGSLDTTFGGTGIIVTAIGGRNDSAQSLVIQANGKIVVVGTSGDSSKSNFGVIRYNSDGTLDLSFGNAGIVKTSINDNADDSAGSVAIQNDGKIVVAGRSGGYSMNDFALARYNTNGSLDNSFGNAGIVITPINDGSDDFAQSIAIQPDGKIIAAGSTGNYPNFRFIIARYNGNTKSNAFDFDGDGRADIAVTRNNSNNLAWYLSNSATGFAAVNFGYATDKIIPADFDGDGKTDITVTRTNADNTISVYILQSRDGFKSINFGIAGDIFVPADYDGDGKTDLAVYRMTSGQGHFIYTASATQSAGKYTVVPFGSAGDKPVIGDFDGDGKSDLAVIRQNGGNLSWYILQSTNGFTATSFGLNTDKVVAADYDGDGKTDIAVFRNGFWYIQRSRDGFTGLQFGQTGDVPVAADYDGDGKADVAVTRTNGSSILWYLNRSQLGFTGFQFGASTDDKVETAFLP